MKEIRNSSKKMSKGFTKTIDRKKNMGKTLFSLFLCLLGTVLGRQIALVVG